jgi:hypothetical protein
VHIFTIYNNSLLIPMVKRSYSIFNTYFKIYLMHRPTGNIFTNKEQMDRTKITFTPIILIKSLQKKYQD